MYTVGFYKDMFERAVATFAQALLAYAGTGVVGITEFDWLAALSLAAMAAVLSVVKAFAAGAGGSETGASFGTAVPAATADVVEVEQYEARHAEAPSERNNY